MNKSISSAACVNNPHCFSALVLFLLLLSGDLAFIALHIANSAFFDVPLSIYNVEQDRGVAEFFQYLKYLWIIALLFLTSWTKKNWHYLTLIMLFAYFLIDDSLTIHESYGMRFAYKFEHYEFGPFWGLRLQDFGELTVTFLISCFLIIPLVLVYRIAGEEYRKFSLDIFILILVLAFFGVGIDMVHIIINIESKVLGVIEDGGEMISLSAINAYVYYKLLNKEHNDFYLCSLLRNQFMNQKNLIRPWS
ncbi:MAG: hypothetical protein ACI9RV_002746 [Glaciecola sp.]|jgi:hypothetical protein